MNGARACVRRYPQRPGFGRLNRQLDNPQPPGVDAFSPLAIYLRLHRIDQAGHNIGLAPFSKDTPTSIRRIQISILH